MTTANFGYETAGSSFAIFGNIIKGSVFTIPQAGTANSITCSVGGGEGTAAFKYAIYNHDTLVLVGTTAASTIAKFAAKAWRTLSFASPPTLVAGTAYILVAWSDSNAPIIYYAAGDANQGHYDADTYAANFPDPLAPTHDNNKYSIYCTYTVAEVGAAAVKRRLLLGVGLQVDVWNLNKHKLKFPRLTPKTF